MNPWKVNPLGGKSIHTEIGKASSGREKVGSDKMIYFLSVFWQFRLTAGTIKAADKAIGISRRAERYNDDSKREGTVSLGCKVMRMNFILRIVNRELRSTDNGVQGELTMGVGVQG